MTITRLKELFAYDPKTGVFTNKVSRGRAKAGAVAGSIGADGYLRVKVDYIDHYLHRLAWLHENGALPDRQIDHENEIKTDNRIGNLREASNSQNGQNKPLQSNNRSGFKGVSLHRASGLWFAYAQRDGIRASAGYHATRELAAQASAALREKLHGEFVNHGYRKLEQPE